MQHQHWRHWRLLHNPEVYLQEDTRCAGSRRMCQMLQFDGEMNPGPHRWPRLGWTALEHPKIQQHSPVEAAVHPQRGALLIRIRPQQLGIPLGLLGREAHGWVAGADWLLALNSKHFLKM